MKRSTYLLGAFAALSCLVFACSATNVTGALSDAITQSAREAEGCDAVDEYTIAPPGAFATPASVPAAVTANAGAGAQVWEFIVQGIGVCYAADADASSRTILYDPNGVILAVGIRQSDGSRIWTQDGSLPFSCPGEGSSGWSGSSSGGDWSGSSSGGDWSGSSSSGYWSASSSGY